MIARCTLALGIASLGLSGCIAAAVPAAAGAAFYKARQDRKPSRAERRRQAQAEAPKPGQTITTEDGRTVTVTALTALPPPSGAPAAAPTVKPAPPEMQYLYGSGEAAAASMQAYAALWNYLRVEIGFLRDKAMAKEVMLAPGSTLDNPRFGTCGKRPMAVVLDIDETALLNLGYEADAAVRGGAYDAARWARWEASGADKVAAVPGAAEALAAARGAGITVVFNSNRSAASAAQTAAALDHAGLGPAVLGDTLWLREDGAPSGKDARRQAIAAKYCIVAMAGDQLGDFTDLFNADTSVSVRRNSVGGTLLAPLWGAGWFILPNPVYGTALKGSTQEIFPPESRWADPEEKK